MPRLFHLGGTCPPREASSVNYVQPFEYQYISTHPIIPMMSYIVAKFVNILITSFSLPDLTLFAFQGSFLSGNVASVSRLFDRHRRN